MNNRISGDFGTDALEAFRAAYAQREVKPEDLEVDQYTGLPTGEITNISPWIQHTGLWKANPGTDRAFVPNQVLETEEDFEDGISEEDFDRMVDEVLSDLEEEERFADEIYNGDDDEDEDIEDEDIEDEELEEMINSILAEEELDDDYEVQGTRREIEVPDDDEIDALIQEIMDEIEQEELEEEREEARNREVSNDELEDMISELSPEDSPEGGYSSDGGETEEELDDDDIDSLIDEILGGYEDDEPEASTETSTEGAAEEESPWSEEELSEEGFQNLMDQVMADDDEE